MNGITGGETTAKPSGAWRVIFVHHLLLIVIAGVCAYGNTFSVPFVFDDYGAIVDNYLIRDLRTFTAAAGLKGRAFGYLTFALNYHIGRLDVLGYHVVNLAIHLLTALLVYQLVRLTFRTPFFANGYDYRTLSSRAALVAALLFVAHPVQTQAVTYIVQRFTSLATLLYLLSVYCYVMGRIRCTEGGARGRFGIIVLWCLSLVTALLAAKTKEIAFTIPVVVLMYELLFFPRRGMKRMWLVVPFVVVALSVPLGFLNLSGPITEVGHQLTRLSWTQTALPRAIYIMTQARVIVTYLRLLVFPAGQNLDYDYPVYRSLLDPPVAASVLLLAFLLVASIWLVSVADGPPLRRVRRLIGFGMLWFFICLGVESVMPLPDLINEHRLYLPSIGLMWGVGIIVATIVEGRNRSVVRWGGAAVGVAVVILVGATLARNRVWRDDLRLWLDVVAKSPEKARGWNWVGCAYIQRFQPHRALPYLQKAVTLDAGSPTAWQNLGLVYNDLGNLIKAETALQMALATKPGDPQLTRLLAAVRARREVP